MLGIDGPEFLVILLVLIVVVGPKDLPKMLKTIAKAMGYVRSTANEFRRQFDDAMRQVELDDLQKTLSDNPIHGVVEDIHYNFDIETTHHKSEKEKEILQYDQNKANEDLTLSVDPKDSGNIPLVSKEREDVS
ncbi:Sec-independent protein translocase protein TatB [Bartonella taylorii]|uniref:Sec-independent protein translocase protein TatB n=1 Tax=Bartonella taylorii TaxID=33046 RepID=UPI001ABB32BA|nr:Sec-independent protein translocase protein TatB [Bartonella taylorii]